MIVKPLLIAAGLEDRIFLAFCSGSQTGMLTAGHSSLAHKSAGLQVFLVDSSRPRKATSKNHSSVCFAVCCCCCRRRRCPCCCCFCCSCFLFFCFYHRSSALWSFLLLPCVFVVAVGILMSIRLIHTQNAACYLTISKPVLSLLVC